MAKTYTLAASLNSGANATVYVTPSYTIAAGAYAQLFITARRNGAGDPAAPTITDSSGRSWTLRESSTAYGTVRIVWMWDTQNVGEETGTTTATFNLEMRVCEIAVIEVEGTVDSPALVQSDVANGSSAQGNLVLAAFSNAANGVIAGIAQADNFAVFTEESGWTAKLYNAGKEGVALGVTYFADTNDTSPTIDSDIDNGWGFIASEIKDTAAAPGLSIPIAAYHYDHHLRSMT